MPDATTNLQLPYILASQAQKHVSHNEALRLLDGLVQLSVRDRDLTAPPGSPADGDRYIVGSGATGDWAGWDLNVALWSDGVWQKLAPREGWRAWIEDEGVLLAWDGAAWSSILPDELQNLSLLGVNGTADANNRLLVQSPGSLLNHEGGGHQLKINKAAAGDTASLLFQTGWSGRAEMGTAGNDDWSIKVSADGGSWTEALRIDAATGRASGAAVQSNAYDDTAGRLMQVGAFGLGGQAPNIGSLGVSDMNDLQTAGMWTLAGTVDNTPFGASAQPGTCIVVERAFSAGPRITQLASFNPSGDEQFWYRQGSGNPVVWGDWREVYHSGSILGAVSESGGTPTGAVIERGSNANGEYVRFADGTQICTFDANADVTGEKTWTFPAVFAARPQVSISVGNANPRVSGFNQLGVSAVNFSAWDINGNRISPVCYLIAIGRWF